LICFPLRYSPGLELCSCNVIKCIDVPCVCAILSVFKENSDLWCLGCNSQRKFCPRTFASSPCCPHHIA